MNCHTPALNEKELVFVLKKIGFTAERQRGSHLFLRHENGRTTVVPVHAGETIGPGLFSKILREIRMTKEEWARVEARCF